MEPSLEPTMAIEVPGSISGPAIIDDLVARIVDRLEKSGDLRATDSYAGYAASISISLQLVDLNRTEVKAEVAVGTIDPQLRVRQTTVGVNMTALEVDSTTTLERPIDSGGVVEAPAQAPQRRQYASRLRG